MVNGEQLVFLIIQNAIRKTDKCFLENWLEAKVVNKTCANKLDFLRVQSWNLTLIFYIVFGFIVLQCNRPIVKVAQVYVTFFGHLNQMEVYSLSFINFNTFIPALKQHLF